jgi:ABC-type sulfate transport system substrate-binding protein
VSDFDKIITLDYEKQRLRVKTAIAKVELDGWEERIQEQEIIAKNYYRPRDEKVAAKYASQFPSANLVTVNDFGGWAATQKKHFDDGGIFDQINSIGAEIFD